MGIFSKIAKVALAPVTGGLSLFKGKNLKGAAGLDSFKTGPLAMEGTSNELAGLLMKDIKNPGPSVAEKTMRSGISQGLGSIRSGLQGVTGTSQGQKSRNYVMAAGQAGRTMAAKGGELRLQEQLETKKQAQTGLLNLIANRQNVDTQRHEIGRKAQEGKAQRRMKFGQNILESAGQAASLFGIG